MTNLLNAVNQIKSEESKLNIEAKKSSYPVGYFLYQAGFKGEVVGHWENKNCAGLTVATKNDGNKDLLYSWLA
jgi:hypothetical protein